jgi:uncharacterized protein YkwD
MKKLIIKLAVLCFLPSACTTNHYHYSSNNDDSDFEDEPFPDPLYVENLCRDAGYWNTPTNMSQAELDKMAPSPIQEPLDDKEIKSLFAYNETVDLLKIINEERVKRKLSKLEINNAFNCAAQGHADDIGVRKICTHTGRDGSNFVQRVNRCGYKYAHGEIVACGQKSARAAVDAWLKSSGHYKIMTDPKQKYFGGGFQKNNYWVVVFAKQ